MDRQTTRILLTCWAMALALPTQAETGLLAVNIDAGYLPDNLRKLERQTGIELLYDPSLVDGLRSPPVEGDLSTEAALQQILASTDLTVRHAESGAWIVERPNTPVLAQQDAAVAEILVVGRRTQNADIRRFENDVQPYNVVAQAEIRQAHRDDLNQFFWSRMTSSTARLPGGAPQSAEILSNVDLRGLGVDQTLILVDGRRMPSIPDAANSFRQADINGIPLHAIKRIEVLTGTASGIYGFGALGGVVNVVLDRDTRGLDLHVTEGITSRGDSGRHGLEASYGHTTENGRTDFSVFGSRFVSDRMLVGQRAFSVNDRTLNRHFVPEDFQYEQVQGNSIAVRGAGFGPGPAANLTFKPEYGGGSLLSTRTLLPTGFSGSTPELVTALTNNAGQMDFGLTPDMANSDLGANPESNSLIMNLRHRFSDRLEAYADVIFLKTKGHISDNGREDAFAFLSAASLANPFTTDIRVEFPITGIEKSISNQAEQTRYTAGLVAGLPFDWRGTLEAGLGSFSYQSSQLRETPNQAFLFFSGGPNDPDVSPFGDWDLLQQTVGTDVTHHQFESRIRNRFRAYSLRLAGPVFDTHEGPATLTVLAERRTEEVPSAVDIEIRDVLEEPILTAAPARSSAATSFYAELRSKLFGEDAPVTLLRGLETQLAVRRDDQDFRFAIDRVLLDGPRLNPRFKVTAFTAGAKITPWPWLMLRVSRATGEQPPTIEALRDSGPLTVNRAFVFDPKRGNTMLGRDGPLQYSNLGNKDLQAVRANSTFVGAVLTPLGADGPSLTIDYSRIRRTRDVYVLSDLEVMAHEDDLPGRVVRAPLTDEDSARGYTGGRVLVLDARYLNGAAREVDAIDARVEWPMHLLGGRLRLYADATYQLNNEIQQPFQDAIQLAGFVNGPLKRRANGGFDWSSDRWTFGANLQYFGSRSVFVDSPDGEFTNDFSAQIQGSTRLRSQSYLDLYASWRHPLSQSSVARELVLDLGVINALDTEPPRESSNFMDLGLNGQGFSPYGDPRLQRFEMVMSVHF